MMTTVAKWCKYFSGKGTKRLLCSASSSRWKIQRRKDIYAQAAHNEGLRSRAAYKLMEIVEQSHFIQQTSVVVDLGASPGGWSMVARQYLELCSKIPWKISLDELADIPAVPVKRSTGRVVRRSRGRLIAVDILDMDPIPGATFIQGDFTERETQQRITKVLYGDEVDVVLSDMCPNTSGVKELDHERIIELAFSASHFAIQHLCNGGTFLCKIFQGAQEKRLISFLEEHFVQVKRWRPKASKMLCIGYWICAGRFPKATIARQLDEKKEWKEEGRRTDVLFFVFGRWKTETDDGGRRYELEHKQCIDTLFSRWTALGLALDHWNRPAEECRQLVDTLQQAILQAAQDNQLCTDFLETLFEETFDILQVDIEDGSIEEVASLLCTMFQDCLQGNRESLTKFLKPRSTISNPLVQPDNCNSQVNQPPKSHYMSSSSLPCGQVPESSDGQVDEDGFQRVQRRRPHNNSTVSISRSNK